MTEYHNARITGMSINGVPIDLKAIDYEPRKFQPIEVTIPLTFSPTIWEAATAQEIMVPEQPESERRHNATCLDCGGPAFHGFGYRPTCERVGGCPGPISTREPTEVYEDWRPGTMVNGGAEERCWCAEGGGRRAWHPTREGAIAYWREKIAGRA